MRNHPQPLRRNSALHRQLDDLILWLKYEDNLDDSSYYQQKVTSFNPHPISESTLRIENPNYDTQHFTHGKSSTRYNLTSYPPLADQYVYDYNNAESKHVYDTSDNNSVIAARVKNTTLISQTSNADADNANTNAIEAQHLTLGPHINYKDYTIEFRYPNIVRVYKKNDLGDSGFVSEKKLGTETSVNWWSPAVGTNASWSEREWEDNHKPTPFNLDPNAEYNVLPDEEVDVFLRRTACIAGYGDKFFSSVGLLIQSLDGVGATTETTFKDSSNSNHTISADPATQGWIDGKAGEYVGSCYWQYDRNYVKHSAPGKVGNSSLSFDYKTVGTDDGTCTERGYLKVEDHTDFDLTKDFTIDFWVHTNYENTYSSLAALQEAETMVPFFCRGNYHEGTTSGGSYLSRLLWRNNIVIGHRAGEVFFNMRGPRDPDYRATWNLPSDSTEQYQYHYPQICDLRAGASKLIGNDWNHIAVTRDDGDFFLHVNGELAGQETATIEPPSYASEFPGGKVTIGGEVTQSSDSKPFEGKIEDFRITKNVARYSKEDFIPPATESPQADSDDQGMLVMLSDGDSTNPQRESRITCYSVTETNGDLYFSSPKQWDLDVYNQAQTLRGHKTSWKFMDDIRYDDRGKLFYVPVADDAQDVGMAVFEITSYNSSADPGRLILAGGLNVSNADGLQIKHLKTNSNNHGCSTYVNKSSLRWSDFAVSNNNLYVSEFYYYGTNCSQLGKRIVRYEWQGGVLVYKGAALEGIYDEHYGYTACGDGRTSSLAISDDGQYLFALIQAFACQPTVPTPDTPDGQHLVAFKIANDGILSVASDDVVNYNYEVEKYYNKLRSSSGLLFCYYPHSAAHSLNDPSLGEGGHTPHFSDIYKLNDTKLNLIYNGRAKYLAGESPILFRHTRDNLAWAVQYSTDKNIEPSYKVMTLPGDTTLDQSRSRQAVLVSGSGVYSLAPTFDSAEEFNLEGDFTIECWAKFAGIPEGDDDDPGAVLWDFGNLKFSNTSGFFSVHGPDGDVTDYYDSELIEQQDNKKSAIENKFIHYAVQRRDNAIELWMDDYDEKGNKFFNIVAEDETARGIITGITGLPYNSARAIGGTISGTNFFTGWIDEFRVWKEALYGPGVIEEGGPSVNGIHVNFRTFNRWDYRYGARKTQLWKSRNKTYVQACKGDWIFLHCTVKTIYDPRWSTLRPLPYIVEWYKDGNLIGTVDSSGGVNRGQQIGPNLTINRNNYGELRILADGSNDGLYNAIVKIGPLDRPKYLYETPPIVPVYIYTTNCPVVHPPPPPPPKATLIQHCNTESIVELGDDVSIRASFWNPSAWWARNSIWWKQPNVLCPPQPITWTWTNKGRGKQKDGCDPSVPFYVDSGSAVTPCYPQSKLVYKNIRKSIKGPICVEATDANGDSYGPICCPGITLKLPNLQCPYIWNIQPDTSSNKWLVTNLSRNNSYIWWWTYYYCKHNAFKLQSVAMITEDDLTLSFNIRNPNASELQTGDPTVSWNWVGSKNGVWSNLEDLGSGTTSGPSHNLYTEKTITLPENSNGTIYALIAWPNYPPGTYTNDPEGRQQFGKEAKVSWVINFPECEEPFANSLHPKAASPAGFANGFRVYNWRWWNRGRTYVSTTQLGGGRESDQSEITINCAPCTSVEFPIQFVKGTDARLQQAAAFSAGRMGLTNTITKEGTITPDGPQILLGRYANINNPWVVYWARYYPDYATFKKTFYKGDSGYFEAVFENNCGERRVKYNINVTPTPAPSLQANYTYQYGAASYWGQDRTNLTFYHQEWNWWNYWAQQYEVYYKKYPSYTHSSISVYNLGGCTGNRITVNGKVVKDWSDDWAYDTTGLKISSNLRSWYGRRTLQMLVYHDRSAWPSDRNTIKFEVSGNLPCDGCYDQGDISSLTYTVAFHALPRIISPMIGMNPRGPYRWWYCGYYNYTGYRSYRMSLRWWRPYCYYWNPSPGYGWTKTQTVYAANRANRMSAGRGYSRISLR
jgi:hypothetical protein